MIYTIIITIVGLIIFIGWQVRIKLYRTKNKLTFYIEHTHYGTYSTLSVHKKKSIYKILILFKNVVHPNNVIVILSKFNNIHYMFFDLDDDDKINLFKTLYAEESYVIYCSSPNHYWGIVDKPHKNINSVLLDTNWNICNDNKYVTFTKAHNKLYIRALYKDKFRKPFLFETHGKLSKNFEMFIDKLNDFYNKEGLELSILKHKDQDLLLQFNRKLKLKEIQNVL